MVRDDPPQKNEPGKNQPSCGEKLPLQTTHTHTREEDWSKDQPTSGKVPPPSERAKKRAWPKISRLGARWALRGTGQETSLAKNQSTWGRGRLGPPKFGQTPLDP